LNNLISTLPTTKHRKRQNAVRTKEKLQSAVEEVYLDESITEEQGADQEGNSNFFIYGLSVGLGIGCIATFVILWITVFFTPRLPVGITYEAMLVVFIYPLIYLLSVGLIALTAGVVKKYYT
jgi:hypothetical protein